ncbi:DUF1801 domain-containing protein [Oleiagrimonas soli]|uniref:YdhG-like domain-containing protein n=1 Tax=Oleiagrimonas soli TaxID=1543381 RepID=A0A099CRT4_9GAMM|nr:DUF1801 domain-containing protein [Oleiagrimonas soli]KGI76718.1 hypothetical protein LF63_0114250 [Oleiagrimonas soli]MBB6185054.1 hypothetical protein [Oleiagrimonas soli]
MSANKNLPTPASVDDYIDSIPDARRREECRTLLEIFGRLTGHAPMMWGPGMIGFGAFHYRYPSGREGDFFATGFAPRKDALSIYLMAGFDGQEALLERLGPHRTGKSCLYIRRLDRVDRPALEALIAGAFAEIGRRPGGVRAATHVD